MTSTHTEIITVACPPMTDKARAAMRARVLAAVTLELDKYNFEQWRDAHLLTLRWQFEQQREHCPHLPYQSFTDYCREMWDKP